MGENAVTTMENKATMDGGEVNENHAHIKRDFAPHRRVSVRVCKDCGRVYLLSDNDAVHYITKYGSLPLRCEACRKRIRDKNPIASDFDVSTDTAVVKE